MLAAQASKLMFDQGSFKPDDVRAYDGGKVVVLAVQREGGHRLDGTLLCDLAQRVDVHLCSAISDGGSCLTKKAATLTNFTSLCLRDSASTMGAIFLQGPHQLAVK
jgi:hypothetical protein